MSSVSRSENADEGDRGTFRSSWNIFGCCRTPADSHEDEGEEKHVTHSLVLDPGAPTAASFAAAHAAFELDRVVAKKSIDRGSDKVSFAPGADDVWAGESDCGGSFSNAASDLDKASDMASDMGSDMGSGIDGSGIDELDPEEEEEAGTASEAAARASGADAEADTEAAATEEPARKGPETRGPGTATALWARRAAENAQTDVPNEAEKDKGVFIDRSYDLYDPVKRTMKTMKIVQPNLVRRRQSAIKDEAAVFKRKMTAEEWEALDNERDLEGSVAGGGSAAASSVGHQGRSNSKDSLPSNASSNDEEAWVLARRRSMGVKRKVTVSNMELVTNWGMLVGKLIGSRLVHFKDLMNAAITKRRVDQTNQSGAGGVMSSVKSRAELVINQARKLAHQTAKEEVDVFDCEWALSGLLAQLFSTEYMDTLILLTKGVRKLLSSQPVVARAKAPCVVFGDIHGQIRDILLLFKAFGYPDGNKKTFIFNGDFVDRGEHQLEVLGLLFALKLANPERVFLVRGNHEDRTMNAMYGFESECFGKLGEAFGKKILGIVQATFEQLPLVCLINEKILVVHGGIGNGRWTLRDVANLPRPMHADMMNRPENEWIYDLMWSDPIEDDVVGAFGVHESPRGKLASQFAWDVSKTFCARNGLSLIIRSHQSKEDSLGFEVMHDNLVMRVFSARDYEGHGNDGAVLCIQKMPGTDILQVRPQVLRSTTKYRKELEAQTRAEKQKRRASQRAAKIPGKADRLTQLPGQIPGQGQGAGTAGAAGAGAAGAGAKAGAKAAHKTLMKKNTSLPPM
eukprot:TRINITY_DN3314_c2_g1_i1.p1 TRINITY_DN3314_c2_g1~~TRINITY_DN3314_c2_g1_i1.p1  ORF type:complete len:797 (-),score=218.28 TRINITY_DN3314_c2_g1_i1:109-2499(-)